MTTGLPVQAGLREASRRFRLGGYRVAPFGARSKGMVRAAGLEPARGFPLRIFLPSTAFAAARTRVCGLDYPFAVAVVTAVGAARLVSTPSPHGAWLGIAM